MSQCKNNKKREVSDERKKKNEATLSRPLVRPYSYHFTVFLFSRRFHTLLVVRCYLFFAIRKH